METLKERYNVGFWYYDEKQSNVECGAVWQDEVTDVVNTEEKAIEILKRMVATRSDDQDTENFFIEREVYQHIANGYCGWEIDDTYGECGSQKRLYEFKNK